MRRNCIEARLIEKEDVKQEQYREFINGPTTLSLLLIKYCATKTAPKRFVPRGVYIDLKGIAKPFQVVCHVCQRSRLSLKRLGLGVNCQPAQGLHLNMLRHLKRRRCNMVLPHLKKEKNTRCQLSVRVNYLLCAIYFLDSLKTATISP